MSTNMALMMAKSQLRPDQLILLNQEVEKRGPSKLLAYVFWFFLGGLGGHRYYVGDIGQGIAMTLTLGGLGIWTLIDVFFIGRRVDQIREQREYEIMAALGFLNQQQYPQQQYPQQQQYPPQQ